MWRLSLYPRKLSLVPQVEECTNTIFGVKVAVVLNKSETAFDISGVFQYSVDLTMTCGSFTLCKCH